MKICKLKGCRKEIVRKPTDLNGNWKRQLYCCRECQLKDANIKKQLMRDKERANGGRPVSTISPVLDRFLYRMAPPQATS